MTDQLLAVDVGGTKCALALVATGDTSNQLLAARQYRCAGFSGVAAIITRYLEESGARPYWLSLGVAGLVSPEFAQLTNLPWQISAAVLQQQFGCRGVLLANDLTALCAALPALKADDCQRLQAGEKQPGQPMAVIAPGTGLGEGWLVTGDGCLHPQGGEGGHCDFAPVDSEQMALLEFMQQRFPAVSYEMLIAGPGLPLLLEFCQKTSGMAPVDWVAARLGQEKDQTPAIIAGATAANPCPLCQKTIALFLAILGSEAGNLALKTYARGGLFVGGGLLPRLAGHVSFTPFLQAFTRKAKMADLLRTIPVSLIMRSDAALLGAARLGLQRFVP